MNTRILNRVLAGSALVGVVFGCSVAVNTGNDGTATPTSSSTVSSVGTGFTTAGVSPGGTGGIVDPTNGGTGGVVNEDGQDAGEQTRSFFTAFQIDPISEDSAGPKFVVAADIDQDGLMDLVSAWNQSQPVQLHLQRRDANDNISFRTITLGGTSPLAVMAGLEVGQIDNDGWLDIVILSKATGFIALCPKVPPAEVSALEGQILVLFNPANAGLIADGDAWMQMTLINPFVADTWIHNQFPGNQTVAFEDSKTKPESAGFTSLVVANIDGVPGDDIIVALNPGECEELGQKPPVNTVDLWVNPGPGLARQSSLWGAPPSNGQSRNVPVSIETDGPEIKDLAVMDVDNDGDLDVVVAVSNAISRNVRWLRNPLIPGTTGSGGGLTAMLAGNDDGWRLIATGWESRPIGSVDSGADMIQIGDIDGDGFDDVMVRSTAGQIVQWFRQPNPLSVEPEFPPSDPVPNRFDFPWPVFTLTEVVGQEPEAIAIGDVTGDNQVELMVAAGGAFFWYDSSTAPTVFDPWSPNTVIQDSPADGADATQAGSTPVNPPGTGVGAAGTDTSTNINTLLVVDLDGDGKNDIIGTLDRRSGTGLSDDRLVWYRNTRTDP